MPAQTVAAPPLHSLIPFAGILLAIAVLPLMRRTSRWWESNLHKFWVSLGCGAAAILLMAATSGGPAASHAALHALLDFAPFIVLLASLYVISGGILVTGTIDGTPTYNTGVLALGAVLANVLGTTGASVLLIRPLLRSNRHRAHRTHQVIFLIFVVSNMGGLLLPIGDPPLFLGYLRGVPFSWTLSLWHMWATAVGITLIAFLAIDSWFARKEAIGGGARHSPSVQEGASTPSAVAHSRIRISGSINIVWLAAVVAATAVLVPGEALLDTGWTIPAGAREVVTISCAIASMMTTPRALRTANHFTFGPIIEVAALFSGLFLAMQPALQWLGLHGRELGVDTPLEFFWLTGALSSVLDNAPTYLVFAQVGVEQTTTLAASAASAASAVPAAAPDAVPFGSHAIAPTLLAAVSCGAVFMGANTYIGNGPNLMVAAIAREDGVPMPSFFGYIAWSIAVLLPLFGLISLLFFT